MEGILAILMTFSTPIVIVWVIYHYRFKQRELALKEKGEPKLLEAAQKERAKLDERVQNLESIVCSVDFELNQRMNRLLATQVSVEAAPPVMADGPYRSNTHTRADSVYGLGQLVAGQVVLGRYTVERELGRGGMGAVYLAHDAKLGERVALKTITSLMAAQPDDLLERLRREVQAARRVTHPNVVRIHDLGEEGPLLFLSMEYIDGETLWARVRRVGPLPVPEATAILAAVADGVAAAHAAGVVHRDLKPQNVLLGGTSAKRIVKVIDFGLAKAQALTGMTATGMILGTPEYMAPEQIRIGACDARSDVYALGALAYYTLCGRPPFEAATPIAVGFAQVHEQPRAPRELRQEIPLALESTVLRALAKEPAARFVDAGEWRRALD